MTCALCGKDGKYELEISKLGFPWRNQYAIDLCDDHKQFAVKLLDSYIFVYLQSLGKDESVKREKQE